LGLGDGAIFVSQQKGLQVDNLLAELGHRSGQCIVLCCEELNLGLEVSQPLLLPLATLQGRDTIVILAKS
jgi:hypothetical protein